MGFFIKHPTQPTMERIQVLLLPKDIKQIEELAGTMGVKTSTLVRIAVKEYLKDK